MPVTLERPYPTPINVGTASGYGVSFPIAIGESKVNINVGRTPSGGNVSSFNVTIPFNGF